MNFFGRFTADKHDRKEKKSSSGQSPTTGPTSPRSPKASTSPRHLQDSNQKHAFPTETSSRPTNDDDQFVDDDTVQPTDQHHGKRRAVSISRSGRYKSKNKGRTRVLSEEIFLDEPLSSPPVSGPSIAGAFAASPATPVSPPTSSSSGGLIKPTGREKSPVRPYITLKTENSMNFAIESTTL